MVYHPTYIIILSIKSEQREWVEQLAACIQNRKETGKHHLTATTGEEASRSKESANNIVYTSSWNSNHVKIGMDEWRESCSRRKDKWVVTNLCYLYGLVGDDKISLCSKVLTEMINIGRESATAVTDIDSNRHFYFKLATTFCCTNDDGGWLQLAPRTYVPPNVGFL